MLRTTASDRPRLRDRTRRRRRRASRSCSSRSRRWPRPGSSAAAPWRVLSVCALMLMVLPRRARVCGAWVVGQGDVRGADVAAAGQRREALHVHAEQPGERARPRPRTAAGTRAATSCTGQWPWHSCMAVPPGTGRAGGGVAVGGEPVGQRTDALRRRRPGGADGCGVPLLELADPLLGEALRRPAARRSRRGSAAPGWRARSSGARARPGRGWSRRTGAPGVRDPWGAARAPSCTAIWSVASRTPRCRRIAGRRQVELRGELGGGDAGRPRRRSAARAGGSRRRSPRRAGRRVGTCASVAGSVALMHTSVGGSGSAAAARQRDSDGPAILATSLLPNIASLQAR